MIPEKKPSSEHVTKGQAFKAFVEFYCYLIEENKIWKSNLFQEEDGHSEPTESLPYLQEGLILFLCSGIGFFVYRKFKLSLCRNNQ